MVQAELVAVTSRSFSNSPILRYELQKVFTQVKFNDDGIKLTGTNLIEFLLGAKRAIIGLETIDDNLINHLPDLKAICKMGTGIDKIDLKALERRKIAFSATPGVNKRSVSELVLGLIFTLQRNLSRVNNIIKQGGWHTEMRGTLLSNKIIGIIGFGAIGQDLSMLLNTFGCQCLIYDIIEHGNLMPHISQVTLDMLLNNSDIISLHLPFFKDHYHFLGKKEFSKMKKGAILINTARGGLIDEDVLFNALSNGDLFAAALDVFENEPNVPQKLLTLENFFATSHIGGSTKEAIEVMGRMAISHIKNMKI